jgi:hypothetical protein
MSNKVDNIYSQKDEEFVINNDFFREGNEILFQDNNMKKKIESYDDVNNGFIEENENEEDNNKKYSIEIKNDIDNDEINNQILLERITEEDNNNKNNEEDDELPLITLNFISICQCCKNKFDKNKCLPYLLKCGHFFCINCIKQYFTDETGIVCPSDGLVAKSIKELKLLKNLIIDSKKLNDVRKKNNDFDEKDKIDNQIIKDNNNFRTNYCRIHEDQKLSHIVNDTNEIICVHCAFERLKAYPNLQIKEITEKYNEFKDITDNIIRDTKKNVELIQHTLELINKNKENELNKLNTFYNNLIKFIESKKNEKILLIKNIFRENTHGLEQKLIIFKEIIELGEEFQKNIEKKDGDINQIYTNIFNNFNKIMKMNKSNNEDNLNNKLKYMKFSSENESSVKDYLNKISNLNILYRIIKYNKDGKQNNNNNTTIFKKEKIIKNGKQCLPIQSNNKVNKNKKKIYHNNKKNISCDNLYDSSNNGAQTNKFVNKNNSLNIKETNYFMKNKLNNNLAKNKKKTNNSTKNQNSISRSPFLKTNFEETYNNKRTIKASKTHFNSNSLLESYFELKDKEKCMSLNNYDNFSLIEKRIESQKNSKSFNNLNILNNFYNLDCSKRSPNYIKKKKSVIHHFNTNKNIDNHRLKICNDTLNKLIPDYPFKNYNLNYQ